MITDNDLQISLTGVSNRLDRAVEALAWAKNERPRDWARLFPDISEQSRPDVERLSRQAQSMGFRMLRDIRVGTIGEVEWGGDNEALDERLEGDLNIEGLARSILDDGNVLGIIAGVVRRGLDGVVRAEALQGYVEPVFSAESPAEIIGLAQIWAKPGDKRGTQVIRVYDLGGTMYQLETTDLTKIPKLSTAVVVTASQEFPAGAPIPRFRIVDTDSDGYPRGLIAALAPLIRSDWASQVRSDRVEEATAFPQLVTKGEVAVDERGPTRIIRMLKDGDASFLLPGDMSQMHEHHDRKVSRLRQDASLMGEIGRGQVPSGEALAEANAQYMAACRELARDLSFVLTQLVDDYAIAEGLGAGVAINVQPSKERVRQQELDWLIAGWREGLIDFGAAVRAFAGYVPTWDAEEVEEWLTAEAERSKLGSEELGIDAGGEPLAFGRDPGESGPN